LYDTLKVFCSVIAARFHQKQQASDSSRAGGVFQRGRAQMNESFSQGPGAGNERGQGDNGQWTRYDEGAEREGRAQEATDTSQEEYAYGLDTRNVWDKAIAIGTALNHTELTVAHLIVAIALTPKAADPFNNSRLKKGSEPFNIEKALQASLNFLVKNVKSHTGEQTKTPFRSREIKDVFRRASEFVVERATQNRNVEISDALKVVIESEQANNFKHLLLSDSEPSTAKLLEAIERLSESIRLAGGCGAGILMPGLEDIRSALNRLVANFKEVASAAVSPREPSMSILDQIRAGTENDFVKLKEIVAAVEKSRAAIVASVASAVDRSDAALTTYGASLANANVEIAGLKALCSRVLILTAVLGVSTIALVGLVAYKTLS
jgi:hypothetical protein